MEKFRSRLRERWSGGIRESVGIEIDWKEERTRKEGRMGKKKQETRLWGIRYRQRVLREVREDEWTGGRKKDWRGKRGRNGKEEMQLCDWPGESFLSFFGGVWRLLKGPLAQKV